MGQRFPRCLNKRFCKEQNFRFLDRRNSCINRAIGIRVTELTMTMTNRSRSGPTLQRGATMAERYRDHLIFIRTTLDPKARLWTVSAHIQFNEGPKVFHDVPLPRPAALFGTEKEAKKYMVRQARTWIDDRLGERERRQSSPKFRLSALWRSLLGEL